MSSVKKMQKLLLDWYDRHQRVMPWRARQGTRPNPYHVWLSEIMLQQTTVVTVGPYFHKFISRWPNIQKLADAEIDEVLAAWAGLGYYARARNLHKCARVIVDAYGGHFPRTVSELIALPGIGPYTAAAVASIAFDQPAVAVDGNVERVVSRYFAITEPLPHSKETIRQGATELAAGAARPGDFTQAFMELGATVCTPRQPKCGLCPWQKSCSGRAQMIAESLPRKVAKKQSPVKYGKVYWITNSKGQFLVQKRTQKGLYQGMYQLPTTEWIGDKKRAAALKPPLNGIKPHDRQVSVRHTFTHFDLVLEIYDALIKSAPEGYVWISAQDMDDYALPTLMKKAVKLCLK